MKKVLLSTTMVLFATAFATAQGIQDGTAALDQTTQDLTAMYDTIRTLLYAAAAIVGMVGLFKIYSAWNNADRDVQKMIISWVGACVLLVAGGAVIGGFFGTGAI